MTLYTISSTQKLIDEYTEKGGCVFQIQEGILGLGDLVLYDEREPAKLKTFVIREIALNEWSNAQTIRAYNKMPKKYRDMIEKGE